MLNVMLGGQQVFKELSFLLDYENRECEWTSTSEKRKKWAEIVVIRSFLPKNSKSMALFAVLSKICPVCHRSGVNATHTGNS